MRFNVTYANGSDGTAESCDIVANQMTAADISKAQRRARGCMDSSFKDCD